MGVGGHFWDLLKPCCRIEDVDFLRDKKVAVDLSFWVVQNETAIKGHVRNPHLRLIFFRTINLFSKFGAYPVFVVDGVPSPLKAQARAARFYRATGFDTSSLSKAEGVSVERNPVFTKHIQECVELLELLGMPILRANGEAEALCAQLNSLGCVDACITGDSDAFLYGAKCVIRSLLPNSREPIECYHMSDIEAGLGLGRKQMVAISLLVGNDHDLQGVPGIGTDTALRFIKLFSEDEVLNWLYEVGKRGILSVNTISKEALDCCGSASDETAVMTRSPHCSHCGHPGSKRDHLKVPCEYCNAYDRETCTQKPVGFKCECPYCIKERCSKEQKRHETWRIKVCQKIAAEPNFPNNKIIDMYLSSNTVCSEEFDGSSLLWREPQTDALVDFLGFHQNWQPAFIRQRILPMLSTILLRKIALEPRKALLLYGQYAFHSIQRVKIKCGHQFYSVKWKRASLGTNTLVNSNSIEAAEIQQMEPLVVDESTKLDESDVPQILVDDGSMFLLTDENMNLVRIAFPEKVDGFLRKKELKESKARKKIEVHSGDKSSGTQRSITDFFRCNKGSSQAKQGEDPMVVSESDMGDFHRESKNARSPSPSNLSRSVKRRLFD
ncbi:flap endonuclease GEN-like 1 [Aristolochia californica]|uniref:flap endonuclease GEN-like 1 n=1 Tax=Aristolochia californica TaxID=171875 RepID=UPI0035DCE4AE